MYRNLIEQTRINYIILSFLHSYKIIKILCLLRLNFLVFLFIPITMINNSILFYVTIIINLLISGFRLLEY